MSKKPAYGGLFRQMLKKCLRQRRKLPARPAKPGDTNPLWRACGPSKPPGKGLSAARIPPCERAHGGILDGLRLCARRLSLQSQHGAGGIEVEKRSRRPRPHATSAAPAPPPGAAGRPPRARQRSAPRPPPTSEAPRPIMPQPKLPSAARRPFSPSSRYSRTPTASMTSARA